MTQPPADIAEFLQTVRPFSGLTVDDIQRAAAELEILYFRQDDHIGDFSASDEAHDLFIIRKGAIQLHSKDGQLLESRGEADVFGHRIQFNSESHAYQARALEDSLIWRLPQAALIDAMARYPSIQAKLSADHGQRLRADSTLAMRVDTLADLSLRPPCTAQPQASVADCAATALACCASS